MVVSTEAWGQTPAQIIADANARASAQQRGSGQGQYARKKAHLGKVDPFNAETISQTGNSGYIPWGRAEVVQVLDGEADMLVDVSVSLWNVHQVVWIHGIPTAGLSPEQMNSR